MNRVKEKAFRTTLSFSPTLYAKAQQIMDARDFTDFSGFIQQLIREEWERRERPVRPHEPPPRKVAYGKQLKKQSFD